MIAFSNILVNLASNSPFSNGGLTYHALPFFNSNLIPPIECFVRRRLSTSSALKGSFSEGSQASGKQNLLYLLHQNWSSFGSVPFGLTTASIACGASGSALRSDVSGK